MGLKLLARLAPGTQVPARSHHGEYGTPHRQCLPPGTGLCGIVALVMPQGVPAPEGAGAERAGAQDSLLDGAGARVHDNQLRHPRESHRCVRAELPCCAVAGQMHACSVGPAEQRLRLACEPRVLVYLLLFYLLISLVWLRRGASYARPSSEKYGRPPRVSCSTCVTKLPSDAAIRQVRAHPLPSRVETPELGGCEPSPEMVHISWLRACCPLFLYS